MTTPFTTSGLSLLRRLELISNQYPDQVAITYLPEGDPVDSINRTYGQLKQHAYKIASSIRLNTSAGDRVLLLLPPGPDYFAAVWGCLLSGVVVVPVQIPQQPALVDFVNKISADCSPALLLTQEALLPALQGVIEIDPDNGRWLTLEAALNPARVCKIHEPESQHMALLQYTSGSTGTPKGVIASHGNLDACIDLMLEVAAIDKNSTVVSWLPLFHNMGFLSFGLLPLSVGAHLVLIPTDKFMVNPARWFIAMSHYRATHSGAPNIGYETCLNFLPDGLLDQLDLSNWDVAAIGSEPLKSNLIDQFSERFSRTGFTAQTFLTTYGFSEATVFCSGADNDREVPRIDVDKASFEAGLIAASTSGQVKTLVSVGTARPNVAIVNPETGKPCADRELGEIWICGPTVAQGYWNKPEITAQTFGQYASDGSGPYVRSGDIGTIADGNLYVVGRRKELIIVGSKKLHPLDIEQVVNGASTHFVPYATIAGAWESTQGEALAIFQELKPEIDPAAYEDIISIICDTVYERFQVNVERIVLLNVGSLPRTHNGKLQRINCCERVDNGSLEPNLLLDWTAANPLMSAIEAKQNPAHEKPTDTELRLISIWQEMLNRSNLSIHADFVSLGGQSIIATRLISRLRDEFRKELTVRDLFKHSTIRQLATHMDSTGTQCSDDADWLQQPLPYDEQGRLPLTSAQKRMWLLQELDPTSSTYHMSVRYQITAGLCVDTLKQALTALIKRHHILHTVYTKTEEGEPRQYRLPAPDLRLECHNLIAKPDQDTTLESMIEAEQSTPFDLTSDLMLRATLYQVEEDHYVLTLTLHHIAADGWSVEILAKELSALYSAYRTGCESPLQPVQWQYTDWTLKHELANGHQQTHHLDYWLHQLQDLPERHSLPLDRPYSGHFTAATLTQQLSSARLQQLMNSGQRHGATLYMQLQLAMAMLMGRLTGNLDGSESNGCDIAIGAAYANRDHTECAAIVGFMVNSLVIRHTLTPDASIAHLMDACRNTVLTAYEHADVPFELLVEKLNPPRNRHYNPLFQVMINLQSKDTWNLELAAAQVHPTHTYNQEAKFDLALDCTSSADGLEIKWEFNNEILDLDTVQRWSGYFDRILTALSEDSDSTWDRIDLLGEQEKAHLLYHLNSTQRTIPDLCVHHLFEQQVLQSPDAVALKIGSQQLTYGELNHHAECVTAALAEHGLQPEDRVAILMERSEWSVIAMLAILKAGAGYVPIDPAYPRNRADFILQDADPVLILTHPARSEQHQSLLDHIVSLELPWLDIETINPGTSPNKHKINSNGEVAPHNLAYMMYTSGSTGTPKGVIIEHRQITNLVYHNQQAPLAPEDCMAHCGNPAFDAATWEVWGALCRGASVAIIAPDTVLNPELFTQELLRQQVTSMMITVSLFNQYRLSLAPVLSRLRYCLVGGEAVDPVAMLETLSNSPPQVFINDYGPTETTVFATCHRMVEADRGKTSIPIGTPVDNTQIYILDAHKQPVPTGVVGEMYVGGAQVARGYWNRPDINAERFLENPYGLATDGASARLYRTGDLARWTNSGEVEFIGRNDSQIKVRGYRIELGEIETAIASQPCIKAAVVRAINNGNGQSQLVAYIVASPDATMSEQALIEQTRLRLQAELPDYMQPSYWIQLAALPLTPHGKLDTASLPDATQAELSRALTDPPRNKTESQIAALWSALLGTGNINRHDNFFGLGGHSLLAVKLVSALQKKGLSTDIRTVFQAKDLADLAKRVGNNTAQANAITPPRDLPPYPVECVNLKTGRGQITPSELPYLSISQAELDELVALQGGEVDNIQAIYPLSPLQEGILFHHLIAQQDDPYLLRSMFKLDHQAALDSFVLALEKIVERHDALRTGIHWRNLEQPLQVVQRAVNLKPHYLDTSTGNRRTEAEAQQQIQGFFNKAIEQFDIAKPPLIELAVSEIKDGYLLGIQAHHIIADHQALEQIFYEIKLILSGEQDQLSAPVPYSHYVLQQRKESRAEHEDYFRGLLSGYDTPAFVFDEHRDNLPRQDIQITEATLDAMRFNQLAAAARNAKVSLSSIAHLAWGLVLSACSGRCDVVFGTVLSGRAMGRPAPDSVVGLFINTVPVRINNSAGHNPLLPAALTGLHHQLSELTLHEHAPLALIKRCSDVAAELPLFNTLLNYRHKQSTGAEETLQQLGKRGVTPLALEQSSHYPIALSINESDTSLALALQTASSVNSALILDFYQTALDRIASQLQHNSPCTLGQISVLPDAFRDNIVRHMARNQTSRLKHLPAHIRFEHTANCLPDKIAIKSGADTLTYAQLNTRANQIANRLIKAGVQANDRVAVYFDRGIDLIAGLIGTLKAGAGYLPLDVHLPDARLRFIVEDATPTHLITSANDEARARTLIDPAVTRILVADTMFSNGDENPEHNRNPQGSQLAYMIYTSGSTGTPKGVAVEHQQLSNLLDSMQAQFNYDAEDTWTLFHSVSFDFAVWEIWGALTSGAKLIVVPEQTTRNSEEFLQLIQNEGVNILNQTPGAFKALVEAQSSAPEAAKHHCLRQIILSGEALDSSALANWHRVNPTSNTQLINMYGITEITVVGTYHDVTHQTENAPSIGRPLPNSEVYILDEQHRLLPPGVVGEIYVGGGQVTRGYWKRPQLNQTRFIALALEHSDQTPMKRLYKSGDLGRWDHNGLLYYHGRNDTQVKIRGYRIELGEIEAQMRLHAAIADAKLHVWDVETSKFLIAYIVSKPGVDFKKGEIHAWLADHLPTYMLPADYILLEALPLTANGKVDTAALPAPFAGDELIRTQPPIGPVEAKLALIWSNLLKIDQPCRTRSFMEQGGDSLLAVQIHNAIKKTFEIELPLRTVFELASIEKLGQLIQFLINSADQEDSMQDLEEGELV